MSVLCCDYMILAKALANRLAGVLEQVIQSDQTYCIPGRSIFDNISFIRDIFDLAKMKEFDLGLISLDQEKAFDRVEHKYLLNTLEAFGFIEDFVNKIKVLYNDTESVVKVNGGLSAPFKLTRGVRQGCPLSGMLYSVAIEPFLHKVRENINGLCLQSSSKNVSLSAYADDVVVLISDQKDIDTVVKFLNDFKEISSAKVNWAKSEAILVGHWLHGAPTLPNGLNWTKGGFKYLGVFLGDDFIVKKNWDNVLERVKGRLNKWKWLIPKMSYRGRILIINNLVASSLWHRLACVDPPVSLLSDIQRVLIDFFWEKLHWVSQSVLYLSKDEGGQGLINVQSRTAAFRMRFIHRLLYGSCNSNWKAVACEILKSLGGLGLDKSLFLMDPQKVDTSGAPIFYKNIFKVWNLFGAVIGQNSRSLFWLLQEPLIYGTRFDGVGNAFFPANTGRLIKAGCTTLGHLVNTAGPVFENIEETAAKLGFKSIRLVRQMLMK